MNNLGFFFFVSKFLPRLKEKARHGGARMRLKPLRRLWSENDVDCDRGGGDRETERDFSKIGWLSQQCFTIL